MKIRPRALQILVLPDEEENSTTESGLVNPDNVEQESKAIGTVLAVGNDIEDIKVGDRVIYRAFSGERVTIGKGADEVEQKLLHDEDVLAFAEDE